MAELPLAKAVQGNCEEEALARVLVCLSLMRYLCHNHALLFMQKNTSILFTTAKICTCEN